MFRVILLIVSFLYLVSCSSTSEEKIDNENITSINTVDSSDVLIRPEEIYSDLDTLILNILFEDEITEKNTHYYLRKVALKEVYGDVYFYNGKTKKVSFHSSDIGLNGVYTCYYNDNESIQFVEAYDHGNDWYRKEFFMEHKGILLQDIINGEFSVNTTPTIALHQATNTWMTLSQLEEVMRTANGLMQQAVYNQKSLEGTRYYYGKIDAKYDIYMQVNEYETWGYGKYHYANASSSLSINLEYSKDSVFITEKDNDKTTGYFKGIKDASNSTITGTWEGVNNEKRMPFTLTETDYYITTEGKELKTINITPEDIEMYGNQVFGTD